MRRWHSLLDIITFPLKVLLFATILMGIGSLVLNPNVNNVIPIESQFIISLAELFRYFGSVIILNFPFFILIKALSKRFSDSIPVFIGIIGYIVFNISTMFFSISKQLPAAAFSSIFGIQVNLSQIGIEGTSTIFPIHTGIIGVLVVIAITRFSYKATRRSGGYGVFSFIDKDVWSAIYTFVLSIIFGLLVATIWPYFVSAWNFVFDFISSDITNPMNLFVYGISDRVLAGLNISQLVRQPFWFSSLGGSWISPTGTNFVGDVAIWTEQVKLGLNPIGFGRLITPYYIINLFAIPAFIAGTFQTFTDKLERRKFRAFFAIAILLSIFVGMLFPFEMFLLFVTPLIYVIHILATGILFAVLKALNITFGYAFTGLDIAATPASVVDLLVFARNPSMQSSIVTILSVGAVTAIAYFALARVYFNYLAYDMMNTGKTNETVEELFTVFGGIDNIRMVHSSLYRLTVLPIKKSKVDFSLTSLEDVSKIVEGKAGYSLTYGPGAYIIRTKMIKIIKDHQRELLDAKKSKSKFENV